MFTFSQLLLNGLAEWESLNVRSGKFQTAYLLLTSLSNRFSGSCDQFCHLLQDGSRHRKFSNFLWLGMVVEQPLEHVETESRSSLPKMTF